MLISGSGSIIFLKSIVAIWFQGAYDLLLVVEGENIQTVSNFIASKLSPMEHVRGTSTHFLLQKYKEDGQVLKKKDRGKRLNISY